VTRCRRVVPLTWLHVVLQVWVTAELDGSGRMRLGADSDSELTRGLAAVLVRCLRGLTPAQLLEVRFFASQNGFHESGVSGG